MSAAGLWPMWLIKLIAFTFTVIESANYHNADRSRTTSSGRIAIALHFHRHRIGWPAAAPPSIVTPTVIGIGHHIALTPI